MVILLLVQMMTGLLAPPVPSDRLDDGTPLGELTYVGGLPDLSNITGTTGVEPWFYFAGDLVNVANGNLFVREVDLAVAGLGFTLRMERCYNSYLRERNSTLGYGWTFNYAMSLDVNSTRAMLLEGDGSIHEFARSGDNFTAPYGKYVNLTRQPDGSYRLRTLGGGIYAFDPAGALRNITDRNGNQLTFTYQAGLLTSVSDDAGISLNFTYSNGRIQKVTDPQLGREVTYTYDAGGNLTRVTDASGNSTLYGYDDDHGLTLIVDPVDRAMAFQYWNGTGNDSYRVRRILNGVYNRTNSTAYGLYVVISLLYDAANRTTRFTVRGNEYTIEYGEHGEWMNRTNPAGGVVRLMWSGGLLTSYMNENGERWRYEYGAEGTLGKEIDPLGNTTWYNWSVVVNDTTYRATLTNVTDRRGYVISFTYDANGMRNATIDATANVTRMEYEVTGHMSRLVLPDGGNYYYNYSAIGRLINSTDPNGNRVEFTYDAAGRLTSVTSPRGAVTQYTYDVMDRLVSVRDPMGNYTNFTYDAAGRLLSMKDARGYTFTYTSGSADRPTSVTDPTGNTTNFTYDRLGNPRLITGPTNVTRRIEYDALGRPTKIIDGLGNTERYWYDQVGRTIRYTDARGATTRYEYDGAGRLHRVTDPLGGTITYDRDEEGNIVSITDQMGRVTRFEYDALGRLVRLTDRSGNTTRFTYDALGRCTRVIDPLGAITLLSYDPAGRLVSIRDPLGNYTNYTYDADGNTITATDRNGNTWAYTYDLLGRVTRVTDPLGNSTRWSYDAVGHITAITDAANRTTTMTYDALGLLERKVFPDGTNVSFSHDALGRRTGVTDQLGRTTTYTYDAEGRCTAVTDATGNVTRFTHDPNGRIRTITYPDGGTMRFQYDAAGRIIRRIDPMGYVWSFSYDAVGNLLNVTDPRGNIWRTTYDAMDRPLERYDPTGNHTGYRYDANGNVVRVIDALDHEYTYTRDLLGRVVRLTLPGGESIKRSYDANGNLVRVEDTMGRITNHTYDALNRLVQTEGPAGLSVTYGYSFNTDRLAWRRSSGNRTTYFDYDFRGLLVNITDPMGNGTTYTYDDAGRLESRTDPDERVTNYTYDAVGRLVQVDYDDGTGYRYAYDSMGRLTTATDLGSLGVQITFTYDLNGRVTSKAIDNGLFTKTYQFSYDAAGNLISMMDSEGGITTYTYDSANRVTEIDAPTAGSIHIAYDALGRRSTLSRPGNLTTYYTYDVNGRLVNISAEWGNGTPAMRRLYAYDAMGNVLNVTDRNGDVIEYEYDALYRLVNSTYPDGRYVAFTYTTGGDRASRDLNGLVVNYTYDPAGRLTAIDDGTTIIYDRSGNVRNHTDAGGTTLFSYDYENRLVNVTLPNGTGVNYYYSPLGDLLGREDSEGLYHLFPVGEDIDLIYDSAGNPDLRTTHGPGIDDILEVTDIGTGTQQVLCDALGSALAFTNGTGAVVGRVSYLPFGTVLKESGSPIHNYRFAGRLIDDATGIYYYRTRFYDPRTGRFTSVDPMYRMTGWAEDIYAYAGDNPVTFVDPFGLGRTPGPSLNINIRETNAQERTGVICISPYSLELIIEIDIDYYLTDVGHKNFRTFEEGGKWYTQADIVETIEHWKMHIFIWIGFKARIERDEAAIDSAHASAEAAREWGKVGTVNTITGAALGLIPGVGTVLGLISSGVGMAIGAAQSDNYEDAIASLEKVLNSQTVQVSYDHYVDVWTEYAGIESEKVWGKGPKVEIPLTPNTAIGPHGPVVITPGPGRKSEPRGPVPKQRPGQDPRPMPKPIPTPKPTPTPTPTPQPVPTGPRGGGGGGGARPVKPATTRGVQEVETPVDPVTGLPIYVRSNTPFGMITDEPEGLDGLPLEPLDDWPSDILWDPGPIEIPYPIKGMCRLGGPSLPVMRVDPRSNPDLRARPAHVGIYVPTAIERARSAGDRRGATFPTIDDWAVRIRMPRPARLDGYSLVSPYSAGVDIVVRNDGDRSGTHDLYVRLDRLNRTDVVVEGFEGGLPSGWSVVNRGSNTTGVTWDERTDRARSGNMSMGVAEAEPGETLEEWLITPAYDTTEWDLPYLGFYFDADNATMANTLEVRVSSGGSLPEEFDRTLLSIVPSEWTAYTGFASELTVWLDEYVKEESADEIRLAFVWRGTEESPVWIDDVRINALIWVEEDTDITTGLSLDGAATRDPDISCGESVHAYTWTLDTGTYRVRSWINATGIDDDPMNDVDEVLFIVETLQAPTVQNATAVGSNGSDLKLEWTSVPWADAYLVYVASDPDEFNLASPVATVNGTTWIDTGVNNPTDANYERIRFYTVRAINATCGEPGTASRVAGKLTQQFTVGGGGGGGCWHAFSIPFQPFWTQTADDLCDAIPNCMGISHYLMGSQVWEFHAKEMGAGSTDWPMKMGEAYMVSVSDNSTYTFIGISAGYVNPTPGLAAPANFTISRDPSNASNVNLSWDRVPGAVAYRIYRSESRGVFDLVSGWIHEEPEDINSSGHYHWLDTSAPEVVEVHYLVVAVDGDGRIGTSTPSRGRYMIELNGSSTGLWNPVALRCLPNTTRSADWLCDEISRCLGMSHYLVDDQTWEFHAKEMPEGATDWDLVLGAGYLLAADGGGMYWYFGT